MNSKSDGLVSWSGRGRGGGGRRFLHGKGVTISIKMERRP
jgi:hypothetical protein